MLDDMDAIWPLMIIAIFGVMIGGHVWLASRVRKRGVGGSALSPIEDMWDPANYRSHIEIQILAERRAPTPSPGDPPLSGTP
jgi:hypothetical protein